MRKSLRHASVEVQEMAVYLGVSRTSVSNWINGRVDPSVQTLRLWALRCGVPFEWLRDGGPDPDHMPPGPGITADQEDYEEMCRSITTPLWSRMPLRTEVAA